MQEILKEYGPAVITVVAVVALVGLITVVIGDGTTGIVGGAFKTLIENFFTNANAAAGLTA